MDVKQWKNYFILSKICWIVSLDSNIPCAPPPTRKTSNDNGNMWKLQISIIKNMRSFDYGCGEKLAQFYYFFCIYNLVNWKIGQSIQRWKSFFADSFCVFVGIFIFGVVNIRTSDCSKYINCKLHELLSESQVCRNSQVVKLNVEQFFSCSEDSNFIQVLAVTQYYIEQHVDHVPYLIS